MRKRIPFIDNVEPLVSPLNVPDIAAAFRMVKLVPLAGVYDGSTCNVALFRVALPVTVVWS